MNHIGLFEGIGGFSLAAHRMKWRTVAWCEWNDWCQKILRFWFPEAIGKGDIRLLKGKKLLHEIKEKFGKDWRKDGLIITAGFPCQPYSHAGQRRGKEDDRYLWPDTRRLIRELKPDIIVLENVAGLLSILEPESLAPLEVEALELFGTGKEDAAIVRTVDSIERRVIATVIEEIGAEGYVLPRLTDGTPVILCIPAAAVNAPHRRDRIWFVAYRSDTGIKSLRGRKVSTNKSRLAANADQLHDVISGYGAGEIPQQQTAGILGHNAAFSHGQGYQWRGPGQSGSAQAEGSGIGKEWQRVWGDFGRVGKPETASNTGGGKLQNGLRFRFKKDYEKSRAGLDNRTKRSGDNRLDSHSSGQGLQRSKQSGAPNEGYGEEYTHGPVGNFYQNTDWLTFPTQSPVCSRDDGFPGRLDGITFSKWRQESIKGYGNAIVPEVALQIFKAINQSL